jgi:hypothetical protein
MRTTFEMTEHAQSRKQRGPSWRTMLSRSVNHAAKVTLWSEPMRQQLKLDQIRAKASAYIENHPQPRAVFH